MGLPEQVAGAVVRLCFRSDAQPQITRKQCAAFGAALYFAYALGLFVLYLISLRAWTRPDYWTVAYFTFVLDRAVWVAVRFFVAASPLLAVFGALAGVLRYQMKRGTDAERAGGGSGFHALMALALIVFYLPVIIVGLPFVLIDRIFGTRLWGDGTSGWICLLGLLLPMATLAAIVRIEDAHPPGCAGLIFLSVCSADSLLSWLVFRWHALGFLAEPEERAWACRFSLASLLLAVLGLGMYLTLLAHLFDW